MKPEDHKKILAQVLENQGDQGVVSGLLTQISDDYGSVLAERLEKEHEIERLKAQNDSLRDTNMRLFLKVGATPPHEDKKEDPEENKPRRFEDLFDEKGNLK